MKLLPIIATVGLLSFSATAIAADDVPTFKKADADGNNSISESEFAPAIDAGVEASYAELDRNKDGKLSKNEYSVILEEDCE